MVATGITIYEALKAYEELKREGIHVRVIDAYSVKPIDQTTLWEAVQETGGRLVTVEDHWAERGLGEAVLEALASRTLQQPLTIRMVKLAVAMMPGSGEPHELLDTAGISARHIYVAVKELLQ